MISLSNSVKHESQPVTLGIPDGSGSSTGELEGVTEGMDMPTDLNPGDLTKFWEIESHNPDQITNVQGRLRLHIAFWQDVLQAPPPILDCIENGYRLPLKFIPPFQCQPNHNSTVVHQSFVEDAVENVVKNWCALRVSERPHIYSPLSVVSNSVGKLRLVLNLRYLNQYLHVITLKYEDLRVAALLFDSEEYLFKLT